MKLQVAHVAPRSDIRESVQMFFSKTVFLGVNAKPQEEHRL